MRLTIFGTGYVGLVTGACLADVRHQVLGVDVDAARIERRHKGDIPMYEPSLAAVVERNLAAGTLEFTADAAAAVAHATPQMIAVGTPPDESAAADQKYGLTVAETTMTRQKQRLFDKLQAELGDLAGKTIAVWGLAFKPNTDYVREVHSRTLLEALWQSGADVRAYDPVAAQEIARICGDVRPNLVLASYNYGAFDGADVLTMAGRAKSKNLVDGRDLYVPDRTRDLGRSCVTAAR